MTDQVAWRVRLKVREGQLGAFKALTEEMIAETRQEPGVLVYERFVSADGRTIQVHERYLNSGVAIAHLNVFRRAFSNRFSQLVDREEFLVFGRAAPELKTLLASFAPLYFEPFGDLDYWPV